MDYIERGLLSVPGDDFQITCWYFYLENKKRAVNNMQNYFVEKKTS